MCGGRRVRLDCGVRRQRPHRRRGRRPERVGGIVRASAGAAGSGPPGYGGRHGLGGGHRPGGGHGRRGDDRHGGDHGRRRNRWHRRATGSGVGQNGCADFFDPGVFRRTRSTSRRTSGRSSTPSSTTSQAVLAGMPRETYHPVTFHFGSETVADAAVRLKGQSSWVDTVMFDANPKMQFVIAFDQVDPHGQFHGVDKIHLDMPRSDWTFLNERMANNWFRKIGIMAPCANSARLNVNGAYYGLYVAEDRRAAKLVEEFFPGNAGRRSVQGRLHRRDEQGGAQLGAAAAVLGREGHRRDRSRSSTCRAPCSSGPRRPRINDADGYYGGSHNFYVYDQGASRLHLAAQRRRHDLRMDRAVHAAVVQAAPDLLVGGAAVPQPPGQHYRRDERSDLAGALRDAVATQVGKWNTAELLGRVDAWSAQIAAAVAEDPHKWATTGRLPHGARRPARRDHEPPAVSAELRRLRARARGARTRTVTALRGATTVATTTRRSIPARPRSAATAIDDDCNGVVDDGCP